MIILETPRGASIGDQPTVRPIRPIPPLAPEAARLAELHRAAILLRAAASNAITEAYYRGYASGISRRIAGGARPNDLEVVAFELLQDAPSGMDQVLGRGYRDGLEGKAIELGGGA